MWFLRILLAALVISTGLVFCTQPTSAQETTATSSLSGLEIDIATSGEAYFQDTSPEPYDTWGYLQEDFLILHDQGEIHISFAQGDLNTESWFADSHENLANTFDVYSVLDEDVSAENGWAMTRETYWLNYELVTYFEFYYHDVNDVSLGVSVHSTEDNIIEYVEWTQENILVGGDPVAMLAEISHLDSLVSGNAGVEPRVVQGDTTTLADWEADGLVSETEWISPNYEIPISWDETLWQIPFNRTNAIITDDTLVEDVITLATTDRSGLAYVYASVNPSGYTLADWDAWWQSEEFLRGQESQQGVTATLIDHKYNDTNSSVILHTTDRFGHSYITIIDTYITDSGEAVTAYIMASPEDIADSYGDYWDGVMAFGDYYPLLWTPEEIEALQID